MKRPIFLLIFSVVVLSAAHAQTSQSTMSYDTLGNRTQRVVTPAAPSREGERGGQGEEGQEKRSKELIPRKYIPSDYETADIREFLPARKRESLRTDPSLPVASIPYQATVTPSGGRVYSVPIRTAAGFEYVPQISLTYNSQGGPGTAGWGWEIGGLSSITLRGKTLYYDGVKAPVSRVDSLAAYAIDGIPLVPNGNPDMASDYPFESAQGHIQVRKNADGTFTALYPDGRLAVYGVANDARPRVEWPMAYTTDAKGNIIYCAYDYYGNDNIISAIYYGYGADPAGAAGRIEFHYSIRPDSLSRYVAGVKVSKTRRLQNVLTFDRNNVMAIYALSYDMVDGVSENLGINYWTDNERINPLLFQTRDSLVTPDFHLVADVAMPYYIDTEDALVTYKRGKLVPGSFSDSFLAHETYPNYFPDTVTVSNWSAYPDDLGIFVMPMSDNYVFDADSIHTGNGFQSIDAVDIDSDGAGELVRIRYTEDCSPQGIYIDISTYDYDADGVRTEGRSSVRIPGAFHITAQHWDPFDKDHEHPIIDEYDLPHNHLFLYGDFSGRGKMELLTLSFRDYWMAPDDSSRFAIITDLDGDIVLEAGGAFPFHLEAEDISRILSIDIDGDGRTELCVADDTGNWSTIYKYDYSQGSFYVDKRVYGLESWALKGNYYLTDLNADGYPDILAPPQDGQLDPTGWYVFQYTGGGFEQRMDYICEAPSKKDTLIMFMDVDRDGLQDMVRICRSDVFVHRNVNGRITGQSSCIRTSLHPGINPAILPANRVNWRGACNFAYLDGDEILFFRYTDPAPPKHQIRTFYDSYENRIVDYHADLSEHHVCSLDEDRRYDASQGYFRETMPLQVLEASVTYMPNGTPATYSTQVSHDLYRYKDPVINSRGLGFCGFGEVKVIHKATSNDVTGFVDFTRTVNDPEKRGVVTEQHSPGSAVFNTYDDHTDIYGYLSPRLMTSVELDSLNATVTTTNVWSYDRFDLPTSSSVSYARPHYYGNESSGAWNFDNDILFEQWRDSTVITYAHKYSPQKFAIGLPTETRQIRIHPTKGQWTRRTTVVYDTLGTGAMFLPLEIREYTGADGDQLVSTTTRTYSPPNFSGGFPGGRVLTEQTKA